MKNMNDVEQITSQIPKYVFKNPFPQFLVGKNSLKSLKTGNYLSYVRFYKPVILSISTMAFFFFGHFDNF